MTSLEDVVASAVAEVLGVPGPSGELGVVGIGVDLVELPRMARVLERTPTFVGRVYTDAEAAYCVGRRDPTERFAARFAAKEAVLKALGEGLWKVPLSSIEVARDDDTGKPSIVLHAAAADLATERGVAAWRLTITHTDAVAVAVAVAIGPNRAVDGGVVHGDDGTQQGRGPAESR